MGDLAIRIDGLGKRYRIGAGGGDSGYRTLRESIVEVIHSPLKRLKEVFSPDQRATNLADHCIWAIKDLSLEIKQGEVVGIIGRNGAGKSTLLKILSEITDPTEGQVELHGRVGSLLEVGTGFHPELTGRDNIYLNGAILGMRRTEISRKFDEIVAFAEVEKFIDTPVKHYSSGMYLRLAFAVAAHLEPEILIVDEVLAVGDASFQKKCLGKMGDVAKEGRTVLFVSHNMPAITRLCERAVYLEGGMLKQDGTPHQVVRTYLQSGLGTMASREWQDPNRAPSGDIARLCAIRIRSETNQCTDAIDIRRPLDLEIEYEVLRPGYKLMPNLHMYNEDGVHVFSAVEQDPVWRGRPRPAGRYKTTVRIPGNLLSEGTMFFDVGCTTLEPMIHQFFQRQAVACQIIDSTEGDTARGDWAGPFGGVVRPLLKWSTETVRHSQHVQPSLG